MERPWFYERLGPDRMKTIPYQLFQLLGIGIVPSRSIGIRPGGEAVPETQNPGTAKLRCIMRSRVCLVLKLSPCSVSLCHGGQVRSSCGADSPL